MPVPNAASRPARILVADDEEGTLALLSEVLTLAGFTVAQARDGAEAWASLTSDAPHLALLDVMMPGLDGREVSRRMQRDDGLRAVPVILFSATDADAVGWRAAGAVAFLQKPFPVRELADVVRAHLRRADPAE
jgi:DNA-binding response OmpR family regulator